ncbi:MAG: asparagine synthase (glutamine-hydrolyzing) [Acidobacteriota bacterium]
MCGIAGFLLKERLAQPESVLTKMCDVIQHRGPDDAGYYLDRGCGIGMRRLSIIDLASGHQPIANEDGSVWIVFNGEIYQFQHLREELEAKGHRFRTRSDTEVILHLYEEKGVACFAELRGMFGVALWDARRSKLILARDRFGKKPLYYAALEQGLYFGSELKCLQAARLPLDLDQEALRLYFQFGYIPDPWSPFRQVRKLPPGSWLSYELDSSGKAVVEQGTYWKMPVPVAEATPGDTREAAAARVRASFDESVRIRMIADVPLGAFLSGGIDSSSVVASMALQSPEPVRTFSIGFEEADYNELPAARLVAQKYKTEHHEILVKPEAISLVERLTRHFDEPFGDSSAIPTFIVSEFAAQHVKVALTGDGGDELFGGYEVHTSAQELGRWDRIPSGVRSGLRVLAAGMPYWAYGKNFLHMISLDSGLARYMERNYAHYHLRKQLLQPEWMLPAEQAWLLQKMGHCLLPNEPNLLTQSLYFEATATLVGDMLVKVDRMSMANSLEVRAPLLDHCLAEVAAGIPHAWKVAGPKGKQILRDALQDRLPIELLSLPKKGFAVPLAHWFRGQLRDMLRDVLLSAKFLGRGIVNPAFVRTLLEEHDSGRRNNSHWLWSLLMVELWFRELEQNT